MEFPNIKFKYSPAWLADKFPGFYCEECYFILSDFLRENYKNPVVKWKAEKLEWEPEEQGLSTEMDTEIRIYKSECENGLSPEQFNPL